MWGKNFPMQYDGYKRTVDQVRTRYGGSEAVPRTPSDADPRSVVAQSRLEEDPRLKTLWAGTRLRPTSVRSAATRSCSTTRRSPSVRVVVQQPGTCMHCHGSVYVPYKKLGGGDLIKGFEAMNQMKYQEARNARVASGGVHRLPRSRDACSCASRGPAFSRAFRK